MSRPKKEPAPKKEPCECEVKGFCTALVCYVKQNCGARDENGNPKYTTKTGKRLLEGK